MEIRLLDPGLVENDLDGTSCFLACIQMALRTKLGAAVPSFSDLAAIIHRAPGQYSWEYAMLTHLGQTGFAVRYITTFDPRRLYLEKDRYLNEFFGTEAAADQIAHSDMDSVYNDARIFAESSPVPREVRVPTKQDITSLINSGWYLIPYVNQRILQADLGYAAHMIFLYGYSPRGIRFHNPGPPSTSDSEVTWDLFMKAWSSPSDTARILMAIKPLHTGS